MRTSSAVAALAGLALLRFLLLPAHPAVAADETIGSVKNVRGTAAVVRDGQRDPRAPRPQLLAGDILETGPDGAPRPDPARRLPPLARPVQPDRAREVPLRPRRGKARPHDPHPARHLRLPLRAHRPARPRLHDLRDAGGHHRRARHALRGQGRGVAPCASAGRSRSPSLGAALLLAACAAPPRPGRRRAAPPPPPAGTSCCCSPTPTARSAASPSRTRAGAARSTRRGAPTRVPDARTAPTEPQALSAAEIEALFGDALAAQPAPPRHFILYFEHDSTELTAGAPGANSRRSSPPIRERASADTSVVGHSDTAGDAQTNLELSLRRAPGPSARSSPPRGSTPAALEITSHGEANPLVPTGDNVSEPRNRRVEVTVR